MKKICLIGSLAACLLISLPATAQMSIKDLGKEYSVEMHRQLILKVYNQLIEEYVDELDPGDLATSAIQGMFKSLDKHSAYMTVDDFKKMRERNSSKLVGIGATLSKTDDGLVLINRVFPNGPASKSIIQDNDIITHVDGKSVIDLELDDVVNLIKGQKGTDVQVTIERGRLQVVITRDEVDVPSVSSSIHDGIGVIVVEGFYRNTSKEFESHINDFKDARVKGIIIDLRNNPGGLFDSSLYISNYFLDDNNVIVSTRGQTEHTRHVANADLLVSKNTPVVVLINERSASAAEIVTGALKQNHRAVVVGNTTYGKGTVQTVVPMVSPMRDGLVATKMTTARYYTPNGKSINEVGISPHILVKDSEKQLEKAYEVINSYYNAKR